MYRKKSAVSYERLFSSAGYIVNKMHSSLEPKTANMLVCLRCWLSNDIWARIHSCYLLFL